MEATHTSRTDDNRSKKDGAKGDAPEVAKLKAEVTRLKTEAAKLTGDLKSANTTLNQTKKDKDTIVKTCLSLEVELTQARKERDDAKQLLAGLTSEQRQALRDEGRLTQTGELDAAKQELEAKKNQLAQLPDEQRQSLEKGLGLPAPPGHFGGLSWLLPLASVVLSLGAILYVFEADRRAKKFIGRANYNATQLSQQLDEAVKELEFRKRVQPASSPNTPGPGASRPAANLTRPTTRGNAPDAQSTSRQGSGLGSSPQRPSSGPASPTTGTIRAVNSPETPAETGRITGSPDRGQPRERVATGVASAAPVVPTAPLPDPAPDPNKPTGDIVADYNKARTLGDDAGDWFKNNYDCRGLSCKNLNERLLDPNVVLVFQEEPRGSFLGVSHRGETRLVPALDKELEVSSSFLTGVFDYPPQITGRLALRRAATIDNSGGLWQLKQSGEIALER